MKKNIPLSLLKAIEPIIINLDKSKFKLAKSNNYALEVLDNDPESEFYFSITEFSADPHRLIVSIDQKPIDANTTNNKVERFYANVIQEKFNTWVQLVNDYQEVVSIYDDPILKKYEEEFYSKLESADEDADTASFSLEQQLHLDESITKIIHQLEGRRDETNEVEVTALIEEAEEIQETITISTKNETFTKLSKLFAKVQLKGLKWIKDIYPIIEKEVITQVVKAIANVT